MNTVLKYGEAILGDLHGANHQFIILLSPYKNDVKLIVKRNDEWNVGVADKFPNSQELTCMPPHGHVHGKIETKQVKKLGNDSKNKKPFRADRPKGGIMNGILKRKNLLNLCCLIKIGQHFTLDYTVNNERDRGRSGEMSCTRVSKKLTRWGRQS